MSALRKVMIERAATAMREAKISDDEGGFPRLFDLLDFSGENKAHTVTNGLAAAAVTATMKIMEEVLIATQAEWLNIAETAAKHGRAHSHTEAMAIAGVHDALILKVREAQLP